MRYLVQAVVFSRNSVCPLHDAVSAHANPNVVHETIHAEADPLPTRPIRVFPCLTQNSAPPARVNFTNISFHPPGCKYRSC